MALQDFGYSVGALGEVAEGEPPLFAVAGQPEHRELVRFLRPAPHHVAGEVEANGDLQPEFPDRGLVVGHVVGFGGSHGPGPR